MTQSTHLSDAPSNRRRIIRRVGFGIGALLAVYIVSPFKVVDSGHVGVRTFFGAVEGQPVDPGIHFVMPIAGGIHEVSVQPHTSVTDEVAATHDQQNVTTQTAVTWSIDPSYANRIWTDFRDNEALGARIIAPVVSNDMKAIISRYDAQELITKRATVASEIADMIGSDLARFHVAVRVGGVNITDLKFSAGYDRAIEAKQIAQQTALQAKYTLEQVETSSQQQVVQAKAAAESEIAKAEGDAKATVLRAQADAEAYKVKEASLTPALLQLTAIQRWNGVLPQYTGGQAPLPFLSVGAAAPEPAAR